jgi:short-subunit dehydrogenase
MTMDRRTAVITGASSGIGAAFAGALARRGYDLVLHGRRKDLLHSRCDELTQSHGVSARFLVAELSDEADLATLERCVRETTNLGMLVNCAGSSSLRHFSKEDIDGQERIVRVHVIAAIRLTHAALQVMMQQGYGDIINVSSVAAFFISPGSVAYCASKLFLNSFTESLYLELQGSGIRVQALCPGYTTTEFHKRLGYDTSAKFFRNFMSAERVVEASLKCLEKGKVICIPGIRYRMAAQLPRLVPRAILYKAVLAVTKGSKYPPPGQAH